MLPSAYHATTLRPVELRLLGPVEVVEDGQVLPFPRRQERFLLALLGLSANRLVPAERLIALLWPDDQPPSPLRTVQVYVSRLRKALPDSVSIEGRDQGYQLVIDPESIDVHRFQQEVRAALQQEAPAQRVTSLRQALRWWRGQALVDVTGEEQRYRLCAGLEEQRLVAVEARIEAELQTGQDAELVAELTGLVANHPEREGMVAALATALFRAGRASEALDVLRSARTRLAREQGLDPWPRLQEIELAILRNDQDLLRPSTPPDGPRPPRQLPAPSAGFVGRSEVTKQLIRLVTDAGSAPTVVHSAIAGMGGIGKTALALEVAHRVADDFPDGQLFLDLRGYGADHPMTASEALGIVLRAVGVPNDQIPGNPAEAALRFRTAVAGRRLLLVLDNARDPDVVRQLLPGSGGCRVIVTSRTLFAEYDANSSIRLGALNDEESRELLASVAGRDRVDQEPDAVEVILRACGNLPLALRVAGAKLAHRPAWPLRHLAGRIADARRRLDQLEWGPGGVRAVFASSLEQLRESSNANDRSAAWAFVRLGLPDSPRLRLVEASRLLDLPEPDAEVLLERLVDSHLLETPEPAVYRLHDLLWSFAREEADELVPVEERDAGIERLMVLYASAAWSCLRARNKTAVRLEWLAGAWTGPEDQLEPEGEALFEWLDQAKPQLDALVLQAMTMSERVRAQALVVAVGLSTYTFSRMTFRESVAMGAAAVEVAEQRGDLLAEGLLRSDIGIALGDLGDLSGATASLRRALDCLHEAGSTRSEIATASNFARILFEAGRYEEAVEMGGRALDLAARTNETELEGSAQLALSFAYGALGDATRQRSHLQAALALERAHQRQWRIAYVLSKLGVLEHRRGRLADAVRMLRESVEVYAELSQHADQAQTEGELGEALLDSGDVEGAVPHLEAGLREAVRTSDQDRAAVLQGRLDEAGARR